MRTSNRSASRPCSARVSQPLEPPWYGPVCPVVWEGRRCEASPYPDVCRACSAVRRCKSSTQPDGGEGLAMRKGYRREAVSEGSAEQTCELMDKNRIQGASVGRAGNVLRSPYPSRMRSVDPAAVHGRRPNLPREICSVSLRRLRLPRGGLTAGQKSAEGVIGHGVGKASEALRKPRGGVNR